MKYRDAVPADAAEIVDFQIAMAAETEDFALDRAICTKGVQAVFAARPVDAQRSSFDTRHGNRAHGRVSAVVAAISMISEACASEAAVYIAAPELAGPRHARFAETLYQAGHARKLAGSIARWPRPALDEAGRVADEIRRRFALD